uniref:Uncharacterized protein n=1 Tax=Parascaris equorum TaxID=6256 RepID=A0A914RIZ8_PAREQ
MSTKTPESFLGENSALVNLDNLMGTTSSTAKAVEWSIPTKQCVPELLVAALEFPHCLLTLACIGDILVVPAAFVLRLVTHRELRDLSLPNSERESNTFKFGAILANNPFLSGSTALPTNPFAAQQRPSPTLNEMINN